MEKCRGSYSTHTEGKTRAGCPGSSPHIPVNVTQRSASVKSSNWKQNYFIFNIM